MDEVTALDRAHAAMEAAPGDDAARLRFYERIAASELFLLLKDEAQDREVLPEVFEVGDAAFVLAFDLESRLTRFTGRAAPYAAMSGRVLCDMLPERRVGLGLNLDVAPSSFLLPPEAVAWLRGILAQRPVEIEQTIARLFAPAGLPEDFLGALDLRLASTAGLADAAYLVGVEYHGGARGHLLAFLEARPGAQGALAQAVNEVLRFSDLEAAMLDVAFIEASDPVAPQLAAIGLRFDLPAPVRAQGTPMAPGADPDKPPILK